MSGAKPPSSPTPVESPFFFRCAAQRVKDLDAGAQRLGEGREADRADHELLRVEPVVGVGAAVDHVHHRDRQRRGPGAAQIPVEGEARSLRGRARDRERDAEDRVGAEAALVLGPVELDQDPVEQRLVARVGAAHFLGDLAVDVGDGLQDALAAVALLVAVAQLQRLALPRRSARGNGGPPGRPAGKQHLDLDRGVAARVQDLAAEHPLDCETHGFNSSLAAARGRHSPPATSPRRTRAPPARFRTPEPESTNRPPKSTSFRRAG